MQSLHGGQTEHQGYSFVFFFSQYKSCKKKKKKKQTLKAVNVKYDGFSFCSAFIFKSHGIMKSPNYSTWALQSSRYLSEGTEGTQMSPNEGVFSQTAGQLHNYSSTSALPKAN